MSRFHIPLPFLSSNRIAIADWSRGFQLAGSTGGAIGTAIVAVVVFICMLVLNHFGGQRKRSQLETGSSQSSDLALSRYNQPDDERTYPAHSLADGQRGNGSEEQHGFAPVKVYDPLSGR